MKMMAMVLNLLGGFGGGVGFAGDWVVGFSSIFIPDYGNDYIDIGGLAQWGSGVVGFFEGCAGDYAARKSRGLAHMLAPPL